MIQMKYERKVFNKREKGDGHFIKLPSNVKHYVYHPKFKSEMTFLYALIIDLHNVELGYAYPSIEQLAFYYGKTRQTTSTHLDVLKEVG
jgi:hypothetical protein